MGLRIKEAMLIKARYELDLLQKDDVAYDIIETIILDESLDDYSKGYLMAKLEEWSESLSDKALFEQFINYVEVIIALQE